MIRLLRVDDAFIHGRVALIWSRKLKLKQILIVNDELINDDFMRITLELAKPRSVELEFIPFHQAYQRLQRQLQSESAAMVVVNKIADAKKICQEFPEIRSVNIGGLKPKPFTTPRKISGNVVLDDADLKLCRQMIAMGVEIEIRQVPDEVRMIIC